MQPIDPSPRPTESRWRWCLGAILVVAFALRVYGLGAHSFWTDEFYALEISSGHPWLHQKFPMNMNEPLPLPVRYTEPDGVHVSSIWTGQARDSHPPIYFILLSAVRSAFGPGEFAARLPSVVFSVALLAVIGLGVRQLSTEAASLWTMAVLAASGLQIGYAQEARNYAMLLAEVYAAAWLVLRAQRSGALPPRDAFILGVLLWATPLTHYLSVGPLAGLVIYGVAVLRKRARRNFLVTVLVAALVCVAVWGPVFVQQYRNDIGSMMRWMGVDPNRGATDVVKRLMVWSWDALAFDNHTPWKVRYLSAFLLVAPLSMFIRHGPVRLWVTLTWAALGSVALSDVLEHTDRLRIWRYTLVAGPALAAGAIVAADRWRTTRHVVPALLLVLCLIRLPAAYEARNVEYRPLGDFMARQVSGPDDVVIIVGERKASWHASVALLGLSHYADWPSPPRFVFITKPATNELLANLSKARRVLVFQANGSSAEAVLPRERLTLIRSFPHLAEVFELRP